MIASFFMAVLGTLFASFVVTAIAGTVAYPRLNGMLRTALLICWIPSCALTLMVWLDHYRAQIDALMGVAP